MLYREFVKVVLDSKLEDCIGEYYKFVIRVPIEVFDAEIIRDFRKNDKAIYTCKYMDRNYKFPFDVLEGLQLCSITNDIVVFKVIMEPNDKNIKRLWKCLKPYSTKMEIEPYGTILGEA